MKKFSGALCVLLLACADSQGPQGERGAEGPRGETGPTGPPGVQGEQGPIGGGLYMSRQDVYCKEKTGTAEEGLYVQVECDDERDLPLMGSCDNVRDPNAVLIRNRPSGWGDKTSPFLTSGWLCSWEYAEGGHPTSLPDATAHLCCIKHR